MYVCFQTLDTEGISLVQTLKWHHVLRKGFFFFAILESCLRNKIYQELFSSTGMDKTQLVCSANISAE